MINVPWRVEASSALRRDVGITAVTAGIIVMNSAVALYYHYTDRPIMSLVFVAAIVMLVLVRGKLLNSRIQVARVSLILGYTQDRNLIVECAECRAHAANYLSGGFKGSVYRAWAAHIEEKHERHVEYGV